MFLPVLLVRQYGIGGWIVFAAPNVLGAAAMAWVLRRPGSSEALVAAHRPALVGFSIVTVAFQAFFVGWVLSLEPALTEATGVLVAATALIALVVLVGFGSRTARLGAAALWVASAGALIHLLAAAPAGALRMDWSAPALDMLPGQLALLPVCIVGFVACPYLDLTFHHARQGCSPRDARWAFGLGFGLLFLVMIVFSLVYARPMGDFFAGDVDQVRLPRGVVMVVGVHMLVQAGFTIALHTQRTLNGGTSRRGLTAIAMALCLILPLALPRLLVGTQWFDLDAREVVYRLFMGFYGLIFPAYAWLCIWPRRGRSPRPPGARQWWLLAVTIALALPCYVLGFVAGMEAWLWPGVAILLLSRAFAPRR